MNKTRFLNANIIKIIACVLMVFDHVGFMFFSKGTILRIIARPAFPLFAFFIAEGCFYTRNKLKHFLLLFSVAVICQLGYSVAMREYTMMNVLITFSLSVILIYELDYFKMCMQKRGALDRVVSALIFALSVILAYFLTRIVFIDYGFFGILLPVFISLFRFKDIFFPKKLMWIDSHYTRVIMCAIGCGLLFLSNPLGAMEFYSLFAIPLLLVYNGKKGKYNLKYLFYAFYPVHFLVLEGIYLLIR